MRKTGICLMIAFCSLILTAGFANADSIKPLIDVVKTSVGTVQEGGAIRLPLITWGGDIATVLANGNTVQTAKGSLFDQAGLKFQLFREDNFAKQVEGYIRGNSPFLRGTMGMINMAAEVISADPRTKPVIVYQMTWSTGGDAIVVKGSIKTAKDLKGKTIAVQAYGPHVDYLLKVLSDAGLSTRDVNIRWTTDLTGGGDTMGKAFTQNSVDAATVIIPDALALTSNGTVGTGAEGSVKGARILMSTKTANRIIADVYAVRSDYFNAHKYEIQQFVHTLMAGQDQLVALFANKNAKAAEYKQVVRASAKVLMDSEQAMSDTESMFGDCEYVGLPGNVKFFSEANNPRGFAKLAPEIQKAFAGIGLMKATVALQQAQWKYDDFKTGLKRIVAVEAPRFDQQQVAQVVQRKQQQGTLKEGELFSFEVFFQPNQNDFTADLYADAFAKVVNLAATYGGAIITVEGHSDPLGFLKAKKRGENELIMGQQRQAAKNLSMVRANAVRDSVVAFAQSRGITLDKSQLAVVGHGFNQPKSGMCGEDPCPPKTDAEWRSNMRVMFRIVQVEAESQIFEPLQ